jgi:hypothetical protein
MAFVTDRRCGRTLGILSSLLAGLVVAAPAQAAPDGGNHHGRTNGSTRAGLASATPSAQAKAGALSQMTHLQPSQVTADAVCPAASRTQVRCAAQALVARSNHHPVRPLVSRRDSLTQVFPRVAHGIAPATGSGAQAPPGAGTPAYLQQAYDLSYLSQTAGASDTVAVVDAYDDPHAEVDLAAYRSNFGLPACTTANGCFHKLNQSGGAAPLPAGNSGWEMEESLDLDAISALCPNCHLDLVEASTSSFSDMDQAEITAAAQGAKQISNSWAGGFSGVLSGTYTFPGVSVIAATGDAGYDGPGWDAYPAALPGVTAAGGTTLAASTTGAPSPRGFNESAWTLSGGWGGGSGCDTYESKPSYQSDTGCRGRSYSDVSADANPSTGLIVRDSGNGGWLLVGGTSLATPLIAGYEAVTGVGSTPQWAYSDSALLNDPTTGSTGSCAASISYICNARVGYDGPTGAGSISGAVVAGGPGISGPGVGTGANNTYTQSVTFAGATLAAGVYPNGLATSYWWQYGTTTAYGQQTAATSIGAGHAPVATTKSLTGLSASTLYHYRLVAQNSDGTTYGYDYTLTTNSLAPVATAVPTIAGTLRYGQTLSATTGSWNPTGTYTYQWQRGAGNGWFDIAGATGSTHTLVVSDVGASLRVAVTATSSYGHATAVSGATGPVLASAPVASAPPTISGTVRVGQALTATTGTWVPGGTYSYQWQRQTSGAFGWSPIAGATGATYIPGAGDTRASLRVGVTASNGYGSSVAYSSIAGPVPATTPAATAVPTISGAGRVGQALTATTGVWNPTGTYVYQWQRGAGNGWFNITGGTGATYTPVAGDIGASLRVGVTATNSYGQTTVWSGAVGPVASNSPASSSLPTIAGIARPGQMLTSTAGNWNSTGTYTYQWQRGAGNGWFNISGATGSSYILSANDLGDSLRISVTLTNSFGRATAYSGAIGPVTTSATAVSRAAVFALARLDGWLRS